MTSHTDAGAAAEPSSQRIQADIDRTRAHMDSTFDALESKLTPGQIMQEGWDLLKGGSGAGAKKIFEIARQHPLPSAVIGVGLGLLLLDSNRKERGDDLGDGRTAYRRSYGRADAGGYRGYGYTGSPDYPGTRDARYASSAGYQASGLAGQAKETVSGLADQATDKLGHAKEKVSDLADQATDKLGQAKEKVSDLTSQAADKVSDLSDTVREQASELGEKVGRGARQARLGFWQLLEERPLVVGAATLAVGLLAGLAVPATEAEDELMGETRDQLLDRAQEGAREVLDKGKHVADAAVDSLKRTAEAEGLSPDKLAEKVKHVAHEATETVKNEAGSLVPDLGQGQQQPQQQQNAPAQGRQGSGQQGQQGQQQQQQGSGQPNQAAAGQQGSGQPKPPTAGQQPAGQPGKPLGKTEDAEVRQPELAKR